MIVDLLNTSLEGGAATAASRLHEALCALQVESRFWCSSPKHEPSFYRFPNRAFRGLLGHAYSRVDQWGRRRSQRQLQRALQGRADGLEIFSSASLGARTPFDRSQLGDVLHLHWVSRMIDWPSFFASIPDEHPIVWTLHDMEPFTGGCHYSGGCEAFTHQCGNCPQLGRSGTRDLSWDSFRRKLAALRHKNLHIVTPSHWLDHAARRSPILREAASFQVIYNCLDTTKWRVLEKRVARRTLGLEDNRIIVGFGAVSLNNRRKGAAELVDALSKVPDKQKLLCLVFGGDQLPPSSTPFPETRNFGYVADETTRSLMYAAMDIFVLPSLEDNSPQTGLEAMACGTPVVAFEVGGIPDYVRPGETGLLARPRDTDDLARQIDWLVRHEAERRRMASAGRALLCGEFDHLSQARKYLDLYSRLLDGGRISIKAA